MKASNLRTSRLCFASVVVFMASILALAPPDNRSEQMVALAEARIKVARKALDELRVHRPTRDSAPQITLWLRRIAETRRDLGGRRNDVTADIKAYINHAKDLEAQVQTRIKAGLDSEDHRLEAAYRTFEAESWMLQALNNLDH